MAEWLKIIGLGVLAAIACGIALDNVTARVCVDDFTIGHAPIFPTDSPTLLALGLGVLASWWVGLGLGIYLAIACRPGRRPKLSARDLVRPLLVPPAGMAVMAFRTGLVGSFAANRGWIWLAGSIAQRDPGAKHHAFLTDLWARLASYAAAFLGGIAPSVWASLRRSRLAKPTSTLDSRMD